MSNVEMNEAFAATVAAVAPVILLVVMVEINNRGSRIREMNKLYERESAVARYLYEGGAEPSREQVLAADDSLGDRPQVSPQYKVNWWYILSGMLVCNALLVAEFVALSWLSTPDPEPEPFAARACMIALVIGFAWVVGVQFMAVDALKMLDGSGTYLSRFTADVRRYREQEARERREAGQSQSAEE
ncbi:hypothetical protein [Streptomyces sp. NPDC058653]|uniref:hypothetical protein n=1 Tax=Streptomyces sp. NPDC058653 TaxID=3346576 RepID=UPI0036540883